MASAVLYYPSIEIKNTEWLKIACLYWNRIYTIAPRSVSPYSENVDTAKLAQRGWLCPLRISEASRGNYLEVPPSESSQAWFRHLIQEQLGLDKEPWRLQRSGSGLVHSDKLSRQLLSELELGAYVKSFRSPTDRWLYLRPDIATLYMTVLAAFIGTAEGLPVVTDRPALLEVVDSVRVGTALPDLVRLGQMIVTQPRPLFRAYRPSGVTVEALLLRTTFEVMGLSSDT
jgi:hypothetical protein